MTEKEELTVAEQIKAKKVKLLGVADPTTVMAGSVDCDEQLHILSQNLRVLTNLIYLTSEESTRLKQIYYKGRFDKMNSVTAEFLKTIAVVASQKDQYVKAALHQERFDWESMSNQHRYFLNIYTTYVERINVYKKTRLKSDAIS